MGIESYLKGKEGEATARIYLEQQGYKIVDQNYHSQQGEVDLVAYDKEFLVFIEVKSYSFRSFGSPFGAITKAKRQSIIHAAKTYLYKNNIKDVNCRFDVLSIYYDRFGEQNFDLIKDAFYGN